MSKVTEFSKRRALTISVGNNEGANREHGGMSKLNSLVLAFISKQEIISGEIMSVDETGFYSTKINKQRSWLDVLQTRQ